MLTSLIIQSLTLIKHVSRIESSRLPNPCPFSFQSRCFLYPHEPSLPFPLALYPLGRPPTWRCLCEENGNVCVALWSRMLRSNVSAFFVKNRLTLLNDAKYFDDASPKFAEMRKMLDSDDGKEKLEAMKRLLAVRPL